MTGYTLMPSESSGHIGQWAHVPEPPDPPEHDPSKPPEIPPNPEQPDKEVDLPPRETPDEVRDPDLPGRHPPERAAYALH